MTRLATLLEGVNNEFFKVNFKSYVLFKNCCFKAVKLVKKVIIVINGVSTIYLWTYFLGLQRHLQKALIRPKILHCTKTNKMREK